MIYNTTLNVDGSLCNSCTIYIILLVIFLVSISISSAFIYFYWYLKRRNTNTITNTYTNNGTVICQYNNMLYYNKINFSERIDINKSKKFKKCMICHYWYILNLNCTYEPEVCNGCHDISMMAYELENIAILNLKGVDYRCVLWNITRNDAIYRLNNSKLDNKDSL